MQKKKKYEDQKSNIKKLINLKDQRTGQLQLIKKLFSDIEEKLVLIKINTEENDKILEII